MGFYTHFTGTLCGAVALTAGASAATATCTAPVDKLMSTNPGSTGPVSVYATYNGSPAFATSTGKVSETVTVPANATTTVTASPSKVTWSSSSSNTVTFTATVTTNGSVAPTGTVTFNILDAGNSIAVCKAVTLTSSDKATCTVPIDELVSSNPFAPVTASVFTIYSGNVSERLGGEGVVVVEPPPAGPTTSPGVTTTTLTASPGGVTWSSSSSNTVTFTATWAYASGSPAPDVVGFYAGNKPELRRLCQVALSLGVARCTVPVDRLMTSPPTSAVGVDIRTSYGGSTSFSETRKMVEVVDPPTTPPTTTATTTTVTASSSKVTWSSSSSNTVIFTATVTTNNGSVVPTGTVTFNTYNAATGALGYMGNTSEQLMTCNAVALTAGRATCTVPVDKLAPNGEVVSDFTVDATASYSGGTDSTGTTFPVSLTTISVIVEKPPATTTYTSLYATSGQATNQATWSSSATNTVTFNPFVSTVSLPSGINTGTVTYAAGSTVLCQAVPLGKATCTVPVDKLMPTKPASPKTVAVTASYSDTTNSSGTALDPSSGTTYVTIVPSPGIATGVYFLQQIGYSPGTVQAEVQTTYGVAAQGSVVFTAESASGTVSTLATAPLTGDGGIVSASLPSPPADAVTETASYVPSSAKWLPSHDTIALVRIKLIVFPSTANSRSVVNLVAIVTSAAGPVSAGYVAFLSNGNLKPSFITGSPSRRVPLNSSGVVSVVGMVMPRELMGVIAEYVPPYSAGADADPGPISPSPAWNVATSSAMPTQATLGIAPATASEGTKVTLTATVLWACCGGSFSMLGPVKFSATNGSGSDVSLGQAHIVASKQYPYDQATVDESTLPPGQWTVTALYAATRVVHSWGSDFATLGSSASATLTVTAPTPTKTTVTASPNPALVGQDVTYTTTVTAHGKPVTSGTVSFHAHGASAVAGCTAATISSHGHAKCDPTYSATGTYPITASYSGTTALEPSSGSTSEVVEAPTPTPTKTCPSGDTGTYPDCHKPPAKVCPSGDTGTYPNCKAPVVVKMAGFVAEKVPPNTVYPHRLHATVTRNGQPVAGYSVTFHLAADSGLTFDGPPVLVATAPTNAAGIAVSPPIRSGSTVGTFVADATASGSSGSASGTVGSLGVIPPSTPAVTGYRMVGRDGGVFDFGSAKFYGSAANIGPKADNVVGLAADGTGGYWLAENNGGVLPIGGAPHIGSLACYGCTYHLAAPIVGIVSTPNGGGYWLVGADGDVFAFGDAGFYGSMGGKHLNAPIVGMARTPHGHGYWLVAKDGGVFAFGSAKFYGSMGGKPLNKPVVGMASTPGGHGYWLVAADGGIFAFGSAQFRGSLPGLPASEQPGLAVVAMTADGTGGYWEATSGGDVYSFGDAPFYGSTGNIHLNRPIVGMAATS